MSTPWAVVLDDVDAALVLRPLPGVEVLETSDAVWVRGPELTESIQRQLPGLRCRDRFVVDPGRQLRRFGESLHDGSLPDGNWVPIRDWLQVELRPAELPAARVSRQPLVMVRTSGEREASLLQVTLDEWHDYGSTASRTRLDRLSFAASGDGRVLVRGTPLPPLPGVAFVLDQGVAVPAGWTWSPSVAIPTLRKLLEVEGDEVVLLGSDGSWESIRADDFVSARRSAIRVTYREYKPSGPLPQSGKSAES